MPPDNLPPLAPFPALSSQPPADEPEKSPAPPAGGASLLSDDQRADFALAADLLSAPAAAFQPPAPEPHEAGSFLLTPDEPPAAALENRIPAMPPVKPRDLLSEDDEPENAVLSSEDGLSLQSLGAALTSENPPAAADRLQDFSPGDLGPFDLPAPLPPPAEPEKEPAFSLLDLAQPASVRPVPVVEEKTTPPPSEAPASKPALIVFPPPAKDTPPVTPATEAPVTFPPPRPTPEPPATVDEEPDDDLVFDAPLLFPVPSALPDAERGLPVAAATTLEPAEADGALGSMLAGALLIGAGIFFVSRVPALAGQADAAASGVLARAALLRGEMLLSAVAGAFCLLMGIGAATLRRWAPPIIHAAGWVVLLSALIGLGVGTAALFHFAGNETTGDATPSDGTAIFAGVGIAGVALPLLLIAIFQRPALTRLCAVADKRERWTDRRSIPALMAVLTGLLLGTAAAALCLSRARFPLFVEWEIRYAGFFWTLFALASFAGAALLIAGKRSGWWLLLLLVLGMGATLYTASAGKGWETLLPGVSPAPGTTAGALLASSSMLPPLLILLMTRKSLAAPPVE